MALAAQAPAATPQETAHAILACRVRRVDANYVNPSNPDELRFIDPMLDIVILFSAVGSTVDPATIRLFDPAHVLMNNRITDISWNARTRGFVIGTEDHGEGALTMMVSGPEAGMMTQFAAVVRTDQAGIAHPLAYMFNGRCGLIRTSNPDRDFDHYVAARGTAR